MNPAGPWGAVGLLRGGLGWGGQTAGGSGRQEEASGHLRPGGQSHVQEVEPHLGGRPGLAFWGGQAPLRPGGARVRAADGLGQVRAKAGAAHRLGARTEVVQAPPGPGSQWLQGRPYFFHFPLFCQ